MSQIKNILPLNISLLILIYGILTWGGIKNSELQKIRSLQKKAISAVDNNTFKADSNPLFSKLKVLNLDDTYKLSVLTFMHGYLKNLKSLAEPNRTKSYKLEQKSRKLSIRNVS